MPQNPWAVPAGYYVQNDGSYVYLRGPCSFQDTSTRTKRNESTDCVKEGTAAKCSGDIGRTGEKKTIER